MSARREVAVGGREAAVTRAGDGRTGVAIVTVALVAAAAWRATLGFSFLDDSFYAVTAIRLARGAAAFADERLIQVTGALPAALFAKLWLAAFGTTGIVLALRLLYVPVALAVGFGVYSSLRPSFGRWASFAPAAALVLVPPYNVLALSYNTVASMSLVLAAALGLRAVRDGSRWAAVGAGACAGAAAAAYPPLAVAGIALVAMVAFVGRDRAVALAAVAGAAAAAAAAAAFVLSSASVGEVVEAYRRQVAMAASMGAIAPPAKLGHAVGGLWHTMVRQGPVPLIVYFLPAGALALIAASRRPAARTRALAVAALPLAVALPAAARWVAGGEARDVVTLGGSGLFALSLFLAPAVWTWSAREGRGDARRLLTIAAPAGLVGLLTVASVSNASVVWGSPVVGLAPLAAALLACGVAMVSEGAGTRAAAGTALCVVALLTGTLFLVVFHDGPVTTLTRRFDHGPLAGIATTPTRAATVAATERVAARWVTADSDVMFLGNPGGYLIVGGRPLTDSAWIGLAFPGLGPIDGYTVRYLARHSPPDVVFMTRAMVDACGGLEGARRRSPLAAYVVGRYRLVERSAGLLVFVRRGPTVPRGVESGSGE